MLRVDVVHRFASNHVPSVQILDSVDSYLAEEDDIEFHVHSTAVPLPDRDIRGMHLLQSILQVVKGWLLLSWFGQKTDVLVINRPLVGRDWDLLERKALGFDNTVLLIGDAEFVNWEKKTNMLFAETDTVLVTSHYLQDYAEDFNDDVVLLPLGVDEDQFQPMKTDDEELILGWLGNAKVHRENLELLIEPLEQLAEEHDFVFHLISARNDEEIHEMFAEVGFDTRLFDWVPEGELIPEVNRFDIGLLPLVEKEYEKGKSAVKALEYMSCDIPVVASDVGENSYLVPDGEAGKIVENDAASWVSALEDLLDERTRTKMGEAAREHVLHNHTMSGQAEVMANEFRKLVN